MKRILVLEDENDLYCLTETFLSELPLEITRAVNGEDGLEVFYQKEFDLIVTDNSMPLMCGIEFTSKLRKVNKKIPIIMFSASLEVKDEAIEAGINKFVEKPEWDILTKEVRQYTNIN